MTGKEIFCVNPIFTINYQEWNLGLAQEFRQMAGGGIWDYHGNFLTLRFQVNLLHKAVFQEAMVVE